MPRFPRATRAGRLREEGAPRSPLLVVLAQEHRHASRARLPPLPLLLVLLAPPLLIESGVVSQRSAEESTASPDNPSQYRQAEGQVSILRSVAGCGFSSAAQVREDAWPHLREAPVAVAHRPARAPPPAWRWWLSSGSVERRSAARCGHGDRLPEKKTKMWA